MSAVVERPPGRLGLGQPLLRGPALAEPADERFQDLGDHHHHRARP